MAKVILILGLLITVVLFFFARAELPPETPATTNTSQGQLATQPEKSATAGPGQNQIEEQTGTQATAIDDQNPSPALDDEMAVPANTPAATMPPATGPTGETLPLSMQPADPTQAQGFGSAVAVWAGTLVIGAPEAGAGAGAVYLFQWDGSQWREAARLTAADGAANDAFGRSVAIHDQIILVGASGHDAAGWETGAAYVFQFMDGEWQEQKKLLPGSPQDVRFGWAVALDEDTAVVGAPNRMSQAEILNIGSATIFTVPDWQQQARLTTGKRGGAVDNDLFGWSVAAHGSTVAVSAHLSDAVYLYRPVNGQWQLETVLQAGTRGAHLGYSIALGEELLVAGAPSANTNGMRSGSAVLYTRQEDGWQETAVLAPDHLRPGSRFGTSVALKNDVIVVGAEGSDGNADLEESGSAYLFHLENGLPVFMHGLFADVPAPFANFGHATSIHELFIFIGAPFIDAPTEDNSVGSIYLYPYRLP